MTIGSVSGHGRIRELARNFTIYGHCTKLDEISRVGIGNVENVSVKWNLKEKSRYFELVEMFDD